MAPFRPTPPPTPAPPPRVQLPPRCAICTQAYGDGTHTPDPKILRAWWAWHRSKKHAEGPR